MKIFEQKEGKIFPLSGSLQLFVFHEYQSRWKKIKFFLAISWKEKLLDRMMNVCSSMTKFSHSIQFYLPVSASLFAYLLDFDDEK